MIEASGMGVDNAAKVRFGLVGRTASVIPVSAKELGPS